MRLQQQHEDPAIRNLARDLGVDSSAARMQRLQTFLFKATGRLGRLYRLNPAAMPAGFRGHHCKGLSPKQLGWLRTMVAGTLGRQKLGGTDLVLDMRANHCQDPRQQVISEYFATLLTLLGNDTGIVDEQVWKNSLSRLQGAIQPWKIVAGPLAAGVQYLGDLDWRSSGMDEWTSLEGSFALQQEPWAFRKFPSLLSASVKRKRQEAMGHLNLSIAPYKDVRARSDHPC